MSGSVYRLTSQCDGYFYIGSTMKTLANRMKHHKALLNDPIRCRSPVYTHFNDVGWENNAVITLVHKFTDITRTELRQHEMDELMKVMDDPLCLNKNRPIRTETDKKESDREYGLIYREKTKEQQKERLRKWRAENPEKWKAQTARYRAKTRETS
jgi:hypothetical protein